MGFTGIGSQNVQQKFTPVLNFTGGVVSSWQHLIAQPSTSPTATLPPNPQLGDQVKMTLPDYSCDGSMVPSPGQSILGFSSQPAGTPADTPVFVSSLSNSAGSSSYPLTFWVEWVGTNVDGSTPCWVCVNAPTDDFGRGTTLKQIFTMLGGGLYVQGNPVGLKNSNYTVLYTDFLLRHSSPSAHTWTLPTNNGGMVLFLVNIGAGLVTLTASSSIDFGFLLPHTASLIYCNTAGSWLTLGMVGTTNTSLSSTVSTPAITSGSAVTASNYDTGVYITIATAGTLTVTYGPSGTGTTLVNAVAVPVGISGPFRIPAGNEWIPTIGGGGALGANATVQTW